MKRSLFTIFMTFSLCLGVSFSVLADPYTGAYLEVTYDDQGLPITTMHDVNPTNQTYSGQNVIEVNAYNNAPILTDNTFNGSTDIKPAFTDITSNSNTYNGTTDITYSSAVGGNLQSNSDSFQTTNVSASDADVSFNDPTFNGSVTLSANNISVGSIDQMDDLLEIQTSIDTTLGHLSDVVELTIVSQIDDFRAYLIGLLAYFNSSTQSTNTSSFSVTVGNSTITFPWLSYTYKPFLYDTTSQTVTRPVSAQVNYYVSFTSLLNLKFEELLSLIHSDFLAFREWYYPLDDSAPFYWRYYNTSTGQQESIGLAGLLYNISWYLGQMYQLQVESGPLAQLAEDVSDAADSMQAMEAQEHQVMQSVTSSIESFVPDLNDIGAFTALAWCSHYLQLCWSALGMYGTVIVISLMLGVCLQFLGYFRYK